MFLAMNRFKIAKGFEEGFEKVWRERDSFLSEVDGFLSFNLLKCTEENDFVLYASHSVWESEKAFEAWTKSDHFRKANAQASAPCGVHIHSCEWQQCVLATPATCGVHVAHGVHCWWRSRSGGVLNTHSRM